jgi:flagellar biosynthesis/type III secretory pathway protein FliH
VPGTREVRISSDPNVMRGGALIEGRERIVDGRVDTALERVFRAISQVQA